jgi:hypothetical protein
VGNPVLKRSVERVHPFLACPSISAVKIAVRVYAVILVNSGKINSYPSWQRESRLPVEDGGDRRDYILALHVLGLDEVADAGWLLGHGRSFTARRPAKS